MSDANAERFYKLTRSDGTDLHSGRLDYRKHMEEGTSAKPLSEGTIGLPRRLCTEGVVHAARVPRHTFSGLAAERRGLAKLAMFEVEGIPVADDGLKQGFAELRVLRELSSDEWQRLVFGLGDLGDRLAAARSIIADSKEFPWFTPRGPVSVDKLQALAAEHIDALIPWARPSYAPMCVLPVMALTNRQDALRSAAAAADAALLWRLRWNMRPYYAIYRAWRWTVVMGDRPNPWLPLIEMWHLGVIPIGPHDGEYLVYVPGPHGVGAAAARPAARP